MTAQRKFASALRSHGVPSTQCGLVAEELLALLGDLIVSCNDCNGVGEDLCDICGGSGMRSGGRCHSCYPIGSGTLECPVCDGHGYVTHDHAESMGWIE